MTPLPAQPLPLANTSAFTPKGRGGSADTPAWSRAWTQAAQLQRAAGEHVVAGMHASGADLSMAVHSAPEAKPASAGFATESNGSAPSEAAPRMATPGDATARASVAREREHGAATPTGAKATGITSTEVVATGEPSVVAGSVAVSVVATPSFAASFEAPPSAATSLVSPARAAPELRAAPASAGAPEGRCMPCVPSVSTDASPGELADPPPARVAAQRTEVPAATPRAPVRVHVDRQEEGCVVWLGVDAGAERLAQHVVSQLALSRPGALPVLAVVCNGLPVYTRTRIPKENP